MKLTTALFALLAFAGSAFAESPAPVTTPVVRVEMDKTLQKVDGFGFSTAWGQQVPGTLMDAFFSRKTGAGFSIIRTRVPFRDSKQLKDGFVVRKDGGTGAFNYKVANKGKENEYKVFTLDWNNWDLQQTKKIIQAIKANPDYELPILFSTPWTPPNDNVTQWKSGIAYPTDKPEVGGTLNPAYYADYADLLADYVLGFEKNMGAPLAALSIQNEPNWKCSYESCDWTADQFHHFLKTLDGQWRKKSVFKQLPKLTIIAPEHNNFNESLILPSLADPVTNKLIGIAGGHLYEYGNKHQDPLGINFKPMERSVAEGKRIWMTEWSIGKFGKPNDIAPNLALSKAMHFLFTKASLNAFVYWWTPCLVTDGKPNKALATLAQYSRVVRPGWHLVKADAEPAKGLLVAAFVNPDGKKFAIVVTNMGTDEKRVSLALTARLFVSMKAYRTSVTEDMADLGAIQTKGASAAATVPGQSITTFHGTITGKR